MEINFQSFNHIEELNKQRELFIECFPENSGTAVESKEHYNWKFHSFPNERKSFEYVAKLNDDIIGYYAALPYPYLINGKKVNAAMVCDVMTGIKARGKGVFTKLGVYSTEQFKNEGLAFSTGYPIRAEVIPGHKKAGWDFPFQIPMYGKFIKMDAFLKSRNKSFLIPFANFALTTYNGFLNSFIGRQKNISIEEYAPREIEQIKGLEDFFTTWKKENPIVLNKSVDFLNWRLGAPHKEYKLLVMRDNNSNKIAGYTILRNVEKEGVPCVGILDFCTLNDSIKSAKLLLKQIIQSAKKGKRELILMMMMKEKAEKYRISMNGFLKTPFPFSFIIKNFDDSLDKDFLFNENNWSLMWIDSDDL